jgi:4-diphosphocytidyl-2-C-methyl-D-erythritol kinase
VLVRAFAKINLSLRVLGTRPDGYHELRTIFQSIALHDTLTITRTRDRFVFSCDDPACPPDRENLVWRAADEMWTASNRRGAVHGVSVHLAKRIPMRAGLGGGSSDAAAAIRAFGQMWTVPIADQRRIGAALGADVPYFFEGGTALGVDRGDRVQRLSDRKPSWVVLVLPAFGISTQQAFAWWDLDRPTQSKRANDLEAPVARRHPEIAKLVRRLKAAGAADAAMTGSGSTVFGRFSCQKTALDAASGLFLTGHRTIVTRTIGRRSYQRQLAAK